MNKNIDFEQVLIDFGQNIRVLRNYKKWNQNQLSEKSGLHRNYISDLERGMRNASIKAIYSLAAAFSLDATELLIFKCINWTENTATSHDGKCDCTGGCGGELCLTCCKSEMFGNDEDEEGEV